MNDKYVFMWNEKKIVFYKIDRASKRSWGYQSQIDFIIHKNNQVAQITEVRTGSFPDTIIFVVEDAQCNAIQIYIWNVKANVEIDAYDIADKDYQILWDAKGNIYLVTSNKKVIFTKERCAIKAYDFQDNEELSNSLQHNQISYQTGHRIDGKNHNWLIFR